MYSMAADKAPRYVNYNTAMLSHLVSYMGPPPAQCRDAPPFPMPYAGPQAFLVDRPIPHDVIKPHFHLVDQFQVVVAGSGRLGKHPLAPIAVHYTDRSTPYGPIVADDRGISFFTLRAVVSDATHFMPGSSDKMPARAGRSFAVHIEEGLLHAIGLPGSTDSSQLIESHPDGLGAVLVRAQPMTPITGATPSGGAGQYALVVHGSVVRHREDFPLWSCFFASPDDAPLELTSGSVGAAILFLQFPRRPAEG